MFDVGSLLRFARSRETNLMLIYKRAKEFVLAYEAHERARAQGVQLGTTQQKLEEARVSLHLTGTYEKNNLEVTLGEAKPKKKRARR